MNSIGVTAVLAVVLLLITTAKGDEGGVSFSGKYFTMTCPEAGKWYKGTGYINNGTTLRLLYDDSTKGLYWCEYTRTNDDDTVVKKPYYFYVRGRVCDKCFELDGFMIVGIIVGDVLLTAGVSLLIYIWAKNKKSTGANRTNKAPQHAPGRKGPPVPPTDYEQLNIHTRSVDTYSTVNNRMG